MKTTNKIILTIIFILTLLSTATFAAVNTFKDVPNDAWYYNDVIRAVEKGLINGKSASTYAPNDNLTYAEAVKLAACMHKLSTEGIADFEAGTPWYASYVKYAKAVSIITKDYNWEKQITRAEYMNIFSKAIPKENLKSINKVPDNAIPDVEMSHSSAPAIYTLYRAGIVQGSDEQYRCKPAENIDRAEVAAILTRMMDGTARKQFSLSITGYDAYDAKLYEYKKEIKRICENVEAYDDYTESRSINKLSLHQAYWYGEDDGGIFKYALYDIDNNNIPELLLTSSSAYNNSLIDIYTLDNGKIVKLFENCGFGERMGLHLLSDGSLLTEGSSGASNSSCEVSKLNENGSLEIIGAYYYDTDGPNDYRKGYTYVSTDEYIDKVSNYKSCSAFYSLDWKMFADLMAVKPNPMDKLPKLSEIKKELGDAYVKFWEEDSVGYRLKDFKIENVTEDTHNQRFTCFMTLFENGLGLRIDGKVKDEKVIELTTMFVADKDSVAQAGINETLTLSAFTLGLYLEEIDTAEKASVFLKYMSISENNGVIEGRIAGDETEETYMVGAIADSVIISFNIRYLPAFNYVGFFED